MSTTVLITGANGGIGLGLVETYLARPSTTVIAAVRDPNHPTSQRLSSAHADPSSKLIIVKIDSKSESDPSAAIAAIQEQGVTSLDIVIANAGISSHFAPLATCDPAVVKGHVDVNGFGPLYLFQATLPLMQKSEKGAKFIGVGSPIGNIGGMEMRPYPMPAYGASKALFHYVVRKVHFEHQDIIALVVDPGLAFHLEELRGKVTDLIFVTSLVQTDMGNASAKLIGLAEAPVPTQASVAGVVGQIDVATKEKGSGIFVNWKGESFPW